MKNIKLILIIFVICLSYQSKADSWIDPSWNYMLDSSDLIAQIEYKEDGDFHAFAKILKIYKGKFKAGDEIYISGFSNRYGPIDKVKKGEKFLVFLEFNEPSEESQEYWQKRIEKNPEEKAFIEAYTSNRAFYVWSPTSGDLKIKGEKVQYDLTQSTYYKSQQFHSLDDFNEFLLAHYSRVNMDKYCNKTVRKLKKLNGENAQNLMKLYFLGYNQDKKVYSQLVKVYKPTTRFALAKLMGNIKTENSRNILIDLLNDKNSIVQGEAVRQLKKEPAEIVAPVLLKHLKSSSNQNFGPSDIMDPVMNRINGGKVEIIKALGELKYKPAIPDLLILLDTKDEYLFKLVIETLKMMGTKDYIPYINKHLDNKTDELIYSISSLIAKDSLVECLPSFKIFISTCDRSTNKGYEYTITNCCGIGRFNDSSTITFLLEDYKRFFTYKDTLESDNQNDWTHSYIETFSKLKVKEARELIYKSIYDWHGYNEDFGNYPKLFEIKLKIEDSLRNVFQNGLGEKGYKLNYCIAFIQNTAEIINGAIPKVKFLIEVTIPSTNNAKQFQEIIEKELMIEGENIFLRFNNGIYSMEIEKRFDKNYSYKPIYSFLNFAKAIPNKEDLNFLQGLLDAKLITESYYINSFTKAINEINNTLQE